MIVRRGHFYRGDQGSRRGIDGDDIGERAADVDPDANDADRLRRECLREFSV